MYRTHRRLAALSVAALAVALTAGTASTAAAAPGSIGTDRPAQVAVHRVAGGYDVTVNGVRRGTVAVTDGAYSVRATASPDGRTVAAITDFDGTKGTTLLTIDADGRTTTVATGAITSAAISAAGTLAYVDGPKVMVGGAVAGVLDGRAPSVLGWTGDGSALLTVQHPDVQNDSTYISTLGRFDPATGTVRSLLASGDGVFYRDLRLVSVDGVQRVSFVLGTDVYRCAGGTSTIGLADENGTVLDLLAKTTDNYRTAIWAPDGRSVAYELMGCTSAGAKRFDPAGALRRIEETNGVYVLNRASGGVNRVVRGLSYNYLLSDYADGRVSIGSAFAGSRAVPATSVDTVHADELDKAMAPRGVGVQARTNPAQHIHQLWDTRDDFNGNSSCGPTSAVIDLVTYQLPNEFGVTVSSPWRHYSKWGRYITDQFTNRGTTFSAAMGDYNRNGSWKGAHGWITGYFCGAAHPCAGWAYETQFLQLNGASVTTGNYDANWVRARINEGKFVIMSGVWGSTQGHLSVVVGYTDDNRFYVHDTYGSGTDGSYDGAYAVYTLGYISPVNMWAA